MANSYEFDPEAAGSAIMERLTASADEYCRKAEECAKQLEQLTAALDEERKPDAEKIFFKIVKQTWVTVENLLPDLNNAAEDVLGEMLPDKAAELRRSIARIEETLPKLSKCCETFEAKLKQEPPEQVPAQSLSTPQ